jgi:uncharacterized protein (DUF2141 family)
MKTVRNILTSLVLVSFFSCAAATAGDLTVEVTGIVDVKGDVIITVFNDKAQWLKKSILRKKVAAKFEKVEVKFENLPDGDYAISVIQDLNSNDVLDRNFMGIPNEPYGFSNDATGNMGPASFDQAKFTITAAKKAISMRLN